MIRRLFLQLLKTVRFLSDLKMDLKYEFNDFQNIFTLVDVSNDGRIDSNDVSIILLIILA